MLYQWQRDKKERVTQRRGKGGKRKECLVAIFKAIPFIVTKKWNINEAKCVAYLDDEC